MPDLSDMEDVALDFACVVLYICSNSMEHNISGLMGGGGDLMIVSTLVLQRY